MDHNSLALSKTIEHDVLFAHSRAEPNLATLIRSRLVGNFHVHQGPLARNQRGGGGDYQRHLDVTSFYRDEPQRFGSDQGHATPITIIGLVLDDLRMHRTHPLTGKFRIDHAPTGGEFRVSHGPHEHPRF